MSDQKIKTAAGKVPINLIPLRALKGASRVFQHGGVKYALGNFLTAEDLDVANRYLGALFRHVADTQGLDGLFDLGAMAKLDDESGLPEIDHAICGLIMLRAILTKRGILPEDPGVSKLVAAVGTDHEPRDVDAPSIEPDDPAAVARACAPRSCPASSECAIRGQCVQSGGCKRTGPRFVVVSADDVPAGANAEYFSRGAAEEWCAKYNCGEGLHTWSPGTYTRGAGDTHAIVDTRPEEGTPR